MWWYIIILISALFLGLSDVYRKKVLTKEHTMQFVTAFMTFLFILSLTFVWKVDFSISFGQFSFIALKSVLILTAFIMIMKALKHTEISKTAPLRNLSIIFVVLLSIFILGESVSLKGYLGIIALLIGTYLVEVNPKLKHHFHPFRVFKNKYSVFIMIYLVAISLTGLVDKIALTSKGIDTYTYLFFNIFFNAIFAWIIQISFYQGSFDVKTAIKKGNMWLGLAAILTIFSDLLFFSALAVPAVYLSLAAPLRRMSSLVSTAFGGRMFHEKHLTHRVVGCIVMLVGVFLILT